jgi:hypothetical protein
MGLRVSANIATQPSRREQLKKMLKSIEGQFDVVRIYHNGYEVDLTDNGKFNHLDNWFEEPEIYCMLDDDIEYPPNYREELEKAVETYKCIVTYHGRILKEPIKSYYKGHQVYDFRGGLDEAVRVDVGGTGVMAFDTRYFHPKGLANSENKRMSDLVFSLEVAKQGKDIVCLPKEHGWFKQIEVSDGIINDRFGDQSKHIKLSKQILDFKR